MIRGSWGSMASLAFCRRFGYSVANSNFPASLLASSLYALCVCFLTLTDLSSLESSIKAECPAHLIRLRNTSSALGDLSLRTTAGEFCGHCQRFANIASAAHSREDRSGQHFLGRDFEVHPVKQVCSKIAGRRPSIP